MKVYNDVLSVIGNTPIVRLNRVVPKSQHQFFAKVEYFNRGGSVKDRIAMSIIQDAEKSGQLKPGGTIVEATSGNTGVGLALVGLLKGYKCVFVMPEKISEEKRAVLRAYGAKVVMTPTGLEPDDPNSHYSVARRIVEETPGAYFTNQYHNIANRRSHYETTGPEIWNQMDGQIDVFVGGAGTGGTLSGISRFFKERKPAVKIVCADPYGSILYETFSSKLVKKVKMYSETEVRNMYSFRENTFYTRSQLSVLYKKDNSGISFSQSAGYQFRHWLAVGAGIGIDNYRWEQGNNLMPVFLELRTYLLKQNLSPYFSLRVGHSFAFEDKSIGQTEAKGDFFINPAIGYRLGTGFPYIDIFCGAKFQKTQYETLDSWSKSHFDITYRRYDIGLAMTF